MATTKRCPHCGKLMEETTLGEDTVLQCPRCKYCEPLPETETADQNTG